MSDPERIGVGTPGRRPMHCPGASLVISHEEQRDLEHQGHRFGHRKDKSRGGRTDVRVVCSREVWTTQVVDEDGRARDVTYGLCRECCGLEIGVREARRVTQQQRGGNVHG